MRRKIGVSEDLEALALFPAGTVRCRRSSGPDPLRSILSDQIFDPKSRCQKMMRLKETSHIIYYNSTHHCKSNTLEEALIKPCLRKDLLGDSASIYSSIGS